MGALSVNWACSGFCLTHTPIPPPSHSFGRRMLNLVGLTTNAPDKCEPGGLWFEVIPPANLSPRDLYQPLPRNSHRSRKICENSGVRMEKSRQRVSKKRWPARCYRYRRGSGQC